MVAVDMHLGLSLPNTWYRARLVLTGEGAVDIVGATLPGTPGFVVGSNGHVAWGVTNSYIDTADIVVLTPVGGNLDRYQTPDGPRLLERVEERLCPADGPCTTLVVEETVWGPVVGLDADGNRLALRWVAHDPGAVTLAVPLALQQARTVEQAIAAAHRGGMPHLNLLVGDRDGAIAWTIIGSVPARYGHDGRRPLSWADGSAGWAGLLPAERVPVVRTPADGRLWSGNGRQVGGDAFALLGDGGYALGARADRIRDRLAARQTFTEADHLAIQLDPAMPLLAEWRPLMLAAIARRPDRADLAAMVPLVEGWDGRAMPDSVGHRLIRGFRTIAIDRIYQSYTAPLAGHAGLNRLGTFQGDGPALRLLTARPAALVPPGHAGWDALEDAALDRLAEQVRESAGGELSRFTWGARVTPDVRHPLGRVVPLLGWLTDPADRPLPGDSHAVRVQARGFGASQRMVVAPGQEGSGLFHMPGGQSGHPLAPYYLHGHDDWADGTPSPLLPGPPVWTLDFTPAAP